MLGHLPQKAPIRQLTTSLIGLKKVDVLTENTKTPRFPMEKHKNTSISNGKTQKHLDFQWKNTKMKEEKNEKQPKYEEFALEVKRLVRNAGKSNIIMVYLLDELIVRYNIK